MSEILKFNGREDFNKLKFLPFNRHFDVRKDLIDSMNRYGFVGAILLIKTSLFAGFKEIFVGDGQNRAMTAAYLNIPFYGEVYEEEFKSEAELVHFIASRHSTQHRWMVDDYIKSYAYLNYQDYKIVSRISHECGYKPYVICSMLAGPSDNCSGSTLKKIKDGTFKIRYKEETLETISISAEVSKYKRMNANSLLALHSVKFSKKFDKERFIQKYECMANTLGKLGLNDLSSLFESWF